MKVSFLKLAAYDQNKASYGDQICLAELSAPAPWLHACMK